MQTHSRELLLLILDSATGTKVWVPEPHTAWGIRAGLFWIFLLMVVAVVFLSFLFIILCSFFPPLFLPSLRKEPYWNPRWQKHAFSLLHLTHHRIHWTGWLFILYEVTDLYIYFFWLTPENYLSTNARPVQVRGPLLLPGERGLFGCLWQFLCTDYTFFFFFYLSPPL